jgi:hypothetical protein
VTGDGLRSRLVERVLDEAQRRALQDVWRRLDVRRREVRRLEADPAGKAAAEASRRQLGEAIAEAAAEKLPGAGAVSVRQAVERVLESIAGFSDLYPSFQRELHALAARSPKPGSEATIRREIDHLIDLGILHAEDSGSVLTRSPPDRLSAGERHGLRGLNLTLLSHALFPEVLERSTDPAWVDPRLCTPKPWRDVHRYDGEGRHLGWVRHHKGRATWFDAAGRLLPGGAQQPDRAVPVVYEIAADGHLIWRPAGG